MRLRVPLSEELRAIHSDQVRSDLQQRVTGVAEGFVRLADELVEPDLHRREAFGRAVEAFREAASGSIDAHMSSGGTAALRQDLQAAFDALDGTARELFAGAGGETAAEAEMGPEMPPETPSALSKFMTALASTFSEAVREMSGRVADEAGVPEPGGAARYTAEYNRLHPHAAAAPAEHLDIQA